MEFPLQIEDQEAFDELVKGRLDRARQEWERQGGIAEARDQAREADSRAQAAEARARSKLATRDARGILREMGVADGVRQQTILRLADFDNVGYDDQGEPNEKHLRTAIKTVYKDLPEVFGENATVLDGAADASQGSGESGGLAAITSEEQISAMPPEQINSRWDAISAFLRGER
jgi:hypothetical protein